MKKYSWAYLFSS